MTSDEKFQLPYQKVIPMAPIAGWIFFVVGVLPILIFTGKTLNFFWAQGELRLLALLAITLCCAPVALAGLGLMSKRKISIRDGVVDFDWKICSFYHIKWSEPVANYHSVLKTHVSESNSQPTQTVYYVTLQHEDAKKCLSIWRSSDPKGRDLYWQQAAQALGLPAYDRERDREHSLDNWGSFVA